MESFKDRLSQLMGKKMPAVWAERVGLDNDSFAMIWKDGMPPSAADLLQIKSATGVSIDWLLTGEGPMKRGETEKTVDLFLVEIDNRLDELEKNEPGFKTWFRIQFKKKFPEIAEGKSEPIKTGTAKHGTGSPTLHMDEETHNLLVSLAIRAGLLPDRRGQTDRRQSEKAIDFPDRRSGHDRRARKKQ